MAKLLKKKKDPEEKDSRYPYTYACDLIRAMTGYDSEGNCKLNRSDASTLRGELANLLGITDEDLAKKMADHFLKHKESITNRSALALERARSGHFSSN
jgi:hypothetical protein